MKELKFSTNLNDLLKTHNMSQQTLANMLGVNQSTVNRWVNGTFQPTYEDLLLISIIFDETIDYLLGKEDLSEKQIAEIKNSLTSKIKKD